MSSTTTSNLALTDEIEAISAIFDEETVQIISSDPSNTIIHLKPPSQPFTFTLSFPSEYPDVPPSIHGTASTGDTSKGAGDRAVKALVHILGNVYQPGAVCLFELISDAGPLLEEQYGDGTHTTASGSQPQDARGRLEQPTISAPEENLTAVQEAAYPPPTWTVSSPLTVQKSTFLAHAAPCSSRDEAFSHISHLISSSKKLAAATHNITAYRVRQQTSSTTTNTSFIQDCDDDGESAAGGRLLHLLQLMECEDVVVVVSRWFGGVKLGGERFRCIGNVAREVLLLGGWGKEGGSGKKK